MWSSCSSDVLVFLLFLFSQENAFSLFPVAVGGWKLDMGAPTLESHCSRALCMQHSRTNLWFERSVELSLIALLQQQHERPRPKLTNASIFTVLPVRFLHSTCAFL